MRWIAWLLCCGLLECSPNPGGNLPSTITVGVLGGGLLRLGLLGGTLQLTAAATDAQGNALANLPVVWSSSAPAIAEISAQGGLVVARSNGTVALYATAGAVVGRIELVVQQEAAKITVAPDHGSLERGATLQLASAVLDAGGAAIVAAPLTWETSKSAVATVSATGLVTGVQPGDVTLTARSGALAASATLSVTLPAVAQVQIAEHDPRPLAFLGDALLLHAAALDARGAAIPEATLSWQSSAPAIAVVDVSGNVTAASNGTAQITAQSGSSSATLPVTVSQAVAAVAISTPGGAPVSLTALGATVQLSVGATDSLGRALGGFTFAWRSSDATHASVDGTGLVTAVRNGAAIITAETRDLAGQVVSGQLSLAVAQLPGTVAVTPFAATIERGLTQQFAASAVDALGNPVTGLGTTWTLAAGDSATITQSGVATGVKAGTATVSATLGGQTGSATLTVVVPSVASVQIAETQPAPIDHLGGTLTLHATAFDARVLAVPEAQIAWSSSAPLVATVDPQSGVITAVGNGSTVITAAVGLKTATLPVAVEQSVARIALSAQGATTLTALGATLQFLAQPLDAGGAAVAGVTVTWTSCDSAAISAGCAATVASSSAAGLVTGLGNGDATVRASGGGQSAELQVHVVQHVAKVTVTPAADTIGPSKTRQFHAAIADANGHDVASAPAPIWSSDTPAVSTVDAASGLATATSTVLAAPASAQIIATVTDAFGTNAGSATLTVDPDARDVASVDLAGDAATPFTSLGAQRTFTATARDSGGVAIGGLTFSWSSSNAQTVSVAPAAPGSASATVTASGNGSAMLTASAGGKDGNVTLTVAFQVASVSAGGAVTTLASVGDLLALTALDSGGHSIGSGVTWVSCDGPTDPACAAATIADVSAGGVVTARKNGSARVTAQTALPVSGGNAAHLDVAVAQQIASVSAQGAATTLAALGATLQLAALDARQSPVAAAGVVWSTSDATVATVSSAGLVTSVGNGAASIQAKGPNDAGKNLGVTVAQAVVSLQPVPVSASTVLTSIGDSLQLAAFDANGKAVPGASFFICDGAAAPPCAAASVGSVSSSGVVTALGNGRARVLARRGSKAGALLDVQVSQQLSSISGGGVALASFGDTTQLTARDARGSAIGSGVSWLVCDGAASPPCAGSLRASVSASGLVTALQNGAAQVTASTTLGSGGAATTSSAFADVSVAQKVAQVSAQGASSTLVSLGATLQLAALDGRGSAVQRAVVWSSDNGAAAGVDQTGLVTAADNGLAHLTAQGPDDAGASLAVTVAQAVTAVDTVGQAPSTLTKLGGTVQLEARDSGAAVIGSGLTWVACDGSALPPCPSATVLSVDSSGLVTGLANGTARLHAQRGSEAGASITVTVSQRVVSVETVTAGGSTTLSSLGATLALRARDAGGAVVGSGITWTACDGTGTPPCPAATFVSASAQGVVTAAKNGAARVTASGGGGGAFLDVTVSQAIASVSVSPLNASVRTGLTVTFTAAAHDARGNVVAGAPAATWSVPNGQSIAGIDGATGVATGINMGGPLTVTAKVAGVSGTATLVVSAY